VKTKPAKPLLDEAPEFAFGIIRQQQPSSITCVQTCLAMALSVDVARVIAVFGAAAMNQEQLTSALTRCGVSWNQFIHGTPIFDGWYFAVVPSLNNRGGNHQILIHLHGGMTVFDPSGATRYRTDGSDLAGWSYLTPFWPGGTLPEPPTALSELS